MFAQSLICLDISRFQSLSTLIITMNPHTELSHHPVSIMTSVPCPNLRYIVFNGLVNFYDLAVPNLYSFMYKDNNVTQSYIDMIPKHVYDLGVQGETKEFPILDLSLYPNLQLLKLLEGIDKFFEIKGEVEEVVTGVFVKKKN